MRVRLTITLAVIAIAIGSSSGFAQNGVPLRAAYQGTFLPQGTEIVVLAREAGTERDGRPQPEFIARDAYPRAPEAVFRRDVLDVDGFSSRRYGRTDATERLYFLYALTPDSVAYWSYSAQRDSLKFDVVSTGVMSVAPILTTEMREDVMRKFFRQRVLVHMPGDMAENDEEPDTADGPAAGPPEKPPATAETSDSTSLVTTRPSSLPHVASARPPAGRSAASNRDVSVGIPALLVLGLLTIASVALARKHRGEVRRLRLRLAAIGRRREEDPVDPVGRELDELRRTQRALRSENAALQKRCAELESELSERPERFS